MVGLDGINAGTTMSSRSEASASPLTRRRAVLCAYFTGAILALAQTPATHRSGSSFHNPPTVSILPRARPSEKPVEAIRTESTLVLIPVTVTDLLGKPMLDLN